MVELLKSAGIRRIYGVKGDSLREIGGRLDAATGRILMNDPNHPELNDLLDDLGEMVSSKGGQVAVIPSEQIPTKTGAAATCRF